MGTHGTRITIHRLLSNIKDHMGAFFVLYGHLEEVTRIWCVPSRDFSVQVILDRTKLQEIPDILCRGKRIFVVVQGRRPHCWLCGTSGHLAKMCPSWKLMLQPVTSKEAMVEDNPSKGWMKGGGEKGVKAFWPSYLSLEGCPTTKEMIAEAVGGR